MQPKTQLNQYVFLEKLGEGGMGEVWKGKHSYLDYEVAIKFLKPEFAGDVDLQDRFLNEGKRQARLDHPNIVRAIDFISDAGLNYLVMKYVEGVALDKRIDNAGGPLHLDEAVNISAQILRALDYAHSRGIIHRDVKPSNILIDDAGNCYLTDFGIALAVGQLRVTRTGSVIGTTYYMSPEQIKHPHDVDPSTDIYSFGVVLFEMLTGVLPFDSEDGNDFVIKQAHVTQAPPKPSKLNPSIGRGMESVVLRALAKDPKERWPNCEAMAQALEAASQSRQTPIRRTRPEGANSAAEMGNGVATPGVSETKRPSGVPGTSEAPRETWFELSRAKVAIIAGALLVTGGLGYTALRISGQIPRPIPPAEKPFDSSAVKGLNYPAPKNDSPPDKKNNGSTGLPEISANSPNLTTPGESQDSTGAQVSDNEPRTEAKPGDLPRKPTPLPDISARGEKPKISSPAPKANSPDAPPSDIRNTGANPNEAPSRKPSEQIATISTAPPPAGTLAGGPGAPVVQRPENPAPPARGAEILRPEVKEPPVERPALIRPPERIIPATGTVTWSLQLKKGSVESLESQAPSAGNISGEGLPGVPVSISISPPGIAGVVEPPAPSNGWKILRLRALVNARIVISIQWKRL